MNEQTKETVRERLQREFERRNMFGPALAIKNLPAAHFGNLDQPAPEDKTTPELLSLFTWDRTPQRFFYWSWVDELLMQQAIVVKQRDIASTLELLQQEANKLNDDNVEVLLAKARTLIKGLIGYDN